MESYDVWSFVSGVFHFVECFQVSSMLWHVISTWFLFIANNITFYGFLYWIYPFFSSWTFGLVPLWLLQIMLVWHTHIHAFMWTYAIIYLDMKLLGHVVILGFLFWGTTRLFSKAAAPFSISISDIEGSFTSLLITLVIIYLVDYRYSPGCEVLSFCGFDFLFP